MRVQPRGTEIHFITCTYAHHNIYLRFLLSKLNTEEARVFTSSLLNCVFTDLTYIVTTYVLSAQLLLTTDLSDQLVPTDCLLTQRSGTSRLLYKLQIFK